MNLKLFLLENNYDTQRKNQPTMQSHFDEMLYLFNKHHLNNDNITSEQWGVLQDIIDNKKIIENKLLPLKKIVNYNLNIVGGSLRDILTGNPKMVNDYDIVISPYDLNKENCLNLASELGININLNNTDLKNTMNFRVKIYEEKMAKSEREISVKEMNQFKIDIETEFVFSTIVDFLMKDSLDYKFFKSNNVQEKYMNHHIMSISQFSGINGKKIDLIVSKYNGMNFLSTFDFEICKVFANLNKITKEELLNSIVPTGSMLKDIENKTFSVDVIKFPKENLEYFFKKHLKKLMVKYPHFQVNLFNRNYIKDIKDFNQEEKERWHFAQVLKLEHVLPVKENKGVKIKI